ncbi:MAG: hypothetical protein Q4A32_03570 [Lachnospiraceae bacterium]|nr:hypothetical protein [Lachnospiraceae bacterium]
MYIVIKMFDDLQDSTTVQGIRSYHRYKPGDTYPREGYTPTSERVKSLLTCDNAQGRPLIAVPMPPEPPAPEEKTAAAEVREPVKAEKPAAKTGAKRATSKKSTASRTAAKATARTAAKRAKG